MLTSEEKKKLAQLKRVSDAVRSYFSFGKIKTFYDLLCLVGYSENQIKQKYFPSEYNQPLTSSLVREYLDDRRIELETAIWLKNNPPLIEHEEKPQVVVAERINTEVVAATIHKSSLKTISQEIAKVNFKLLPHQVKAAYQIIQKIEQGKRGIALSAPTGSGKTIILGEVLLTLRQKQFHLKSVSPWPYFYVTKANIVEQTKRDLENFFGLKHPHDVYVCNIEMLRSKMGELFVDETLNIINGVEAIEWKWRPFIHPILIIWDEAHILKNDSSEQHKIGAALNDLDEYVVQIFSSATLFEKVADAKCFCVATRVMQKYSSIVECELTNQRWPSFAASIAHPAKPHDWNNAAINRLRDFMDDYFVNVKNVKSQFHASNSIERIPFSTSEGAKDYNESVERYKKKVAKAEGNEKLSASQVNIIKLVALTQYRKGAEGNRDRIKYIGDQMHHAVETGLYQVAAAFNFKDSIIALCEYLKKEHGVSREEISLIWGGGPTEPTKKEKAKAKIESSPELLEALASAGITMEDLDLEDIEGKITVDAAIATTYRVQSLRQRQFEVDEYQKGKRKYCFYTFRAGGTGLSLEHSDKQTKYKVQRKPSGFAVEEDIINVESLQRVLWIAPTWSGIEMIQGSGRCARINSLSDTKQFFVFFEGTVEEQVAEVVSCKLKNIRSVTRDPSASWTGLILGESPNKYIDTSTEPVEDDSDEFVSEI